MKAEAVRNYLMRQFMLKEWKAVPANALDEQVFEALVPANHYLRRVKAAVSFDAVRPILAECYSAMTGRPAVEPILLLKLEFLQYHYNLSDREVIAQARVNVAYRFFLDLGLRSPLPHHTLLTYFRERLGAEQHQRVFDAVVSQARQHGLVQDRLRLKDATHVIANIAVPSTIHLVARIRERLLAAAEPLWSAWAAQEHEQAATVRLLTESLSDGERLLQRVTHLRQIVADLEQKLQEHPQAAGMTAARRQRLEVTLRLAHRVVADRNPKSRDSKRDEVGSVNDPDARRGKHGQWYTGYLLDVAEDADSEIITAVNLLPGNSDEATDAATLISKEEQAHGNDVQMLSMDGVGFRGELLRELTDPQRLRLEVITPPTPERTRTGFAPEAFVLDSQGEELTCPAGAKTRTRLSEQRSHGWRYFFPAKSCARCSIRSQCLPNPEQKTRRSVIKNDYEVEYRRARAKAQTPEFARVRKEHPKIERKLAEMVRWHRGRRARYWGQSKVMVQALLTAMVVNVKRMAHLLGGVPRALAAGTVRAELTPSC
jgi:transposase